jgi:RNA polymerase sigma-70 factor (ECF subfamily)
MTATIPARPGITGPALQSGTGERAGAGGPRAAPSATRHGGPLPQPTKRARFEEAILPHLDAAYNLARWLTGSDHDAEDVVQEAYLRAYKFFDSYRGGDSRAWLFSVVRNTCRTWIKQNRKVDTELYDDDLHGASDAFDPEAPLLQKASVELVREALEQLPLVFREVVVLRDLEDFSYHDVAAIAGVPLGTVMSRLNRGRARLGHYLAERLGKES